MRSSNADSKFVIYAKTTEICASLEGLGLRSLKPDRASGERRPTVLMQNGNP